MRSEQPSFTDVEYGNRRRVSRREQFLETMDATIPWAEWVGLIEPHYYTEQARPEADAVGDDAADVPAAGVVPPVR